MPRLNSIALVALVSLAACGGEPVDSHAGHDHSGGDHSGQEYEAAHAHEAPRGGALVVLREEGAHVELLADSATGHLSLLVLGAHAEQPVRIAQKSLELTLEELGQSGFRRVDPDVVILGGAPCARW